MNVIFYAILFYLLYRFLTGFLIPVFKTTRQVRKQFNEMNRQQQSAPANGGAPDAPPRSESRANTSKVGEYIDFEEVK